MRAVHQLAPARHRGPAAVVLALFVAVAVCLGGTTFSDQNAEASTASGRLAAARTPSPDSLTLPGRIGAPDDVRQMVTITSPTWASTVGTLKAWQRPAGGRWTKMHGPLPVVLGYHGWVIAARRVQSTGTSPAGRFGLPAAFGVLPNPGTALRYRHVDSSDWWPYEPRDPATYNIYELHKDSRSSWRADYAEHLASYPVQYAYAIIVGFNLPRGVHFSAERNQRVATHPADTALGGGIFLHVRGSGSTAGCVAMDQVHVRWLLGWLAPAKHPQVVMGPYDYVLKL